MGHGHHAINVGICPQPVREKMARDGAGDVRRTRDCGDDRDVVAGTDLTVGSTVPEEGALFPLRNEIHRLRISTEGIVQRQVAHSEVVLVHMVAGLDRLFGETNDLTVAPYRLAYRDVFQRYFVAAGNGLTKG